MLAEPLVGNSAPIGSGVAGIDLSTASGVELPERPYVGNVGATEVLAMAPVPYVEDYGWFFGNEGAASDGGVGASTVVDVDPGIGAACTLAALQPAGDSPLVDAGSPALLDPDGTRSDIGAFGGPNAALGVWDDVDGDGVPALADCDDGDPDVAVGAVEVCNGIDDDCDGLVDAADDALDGAWLARDGDGDGLGDPTRAGFVCPAPGWVGNADDCDDVNPGVGGSATGTATATATDTARARPCPAARHPGRTSWPIGATTATTATTRYPGALEQCNEVDDDCNGLVDDDPQYVPWYPDADRDGYGLTQGRARSTAWRWGRLGAAGRRLRRPGTLGPTPARPSAGALGDEDCDGLVDEDDPHPRPGHAHRLRPRRRRRRVRRRRRRARPRLHRAPRHRRRPHRL
ncbi:MAG: putative metal-binding motif-containing protein [Myxococcota bacterium]